MVTSFKDRKTTSVVSTPSSASSNPGVLLGGVSGSRTPTLSLNNIHYPISEAPSSHPPLPPVAGREQATTVNETMTSRAEEVIGGEVILWEPSLRQASCHLRWREGHEPDFQDICASSKTLSTYISKNVVNPFLEHAGDNTIKIFFAGAGQGPLRNSVWRIRVVGLIEVWSEGVTWVEHW